MRVSIQTFKSELEPDHPIYGRITPVSIENASLAIIVLSEDEEALVMDIEVFIPRVEAILKEIFAV